VCQRHAPAIRAAVASVASPPPLTVAATRQRRYSGLPANRPGPTRAEQQAAERRAIAHELGLDRRTVSTWLAAGRFPERKPRASPVRSATEPFPAEIAARYAAGEDNAAAILCQYLRPYHTFTILTSASTPVP
jgi:hypothetical protein